MKTKKRNLVPPLLLAVLLALTSARGQEPCKAMGALSADVEISADPATAVTAISPYLYGQFVENMGRGVRDGVWAEKLQDRKFLLAPGKSWQVVKPAESDADVFHDPAGAYGGDHAMAIWVRDSKARPCGIRQDGIGLLQGKEYVGYAILAHAASKVPVEIRLSWGTGAAEGQTVTLSDVDSVYKKFAFRFRSEVTTNNANLAVTLASPGYLWIGCLSLMPADNVHGMRADTLELLHKLNATLYRWPGGNFVSGYSWKDGIGPRDRRPPRWERAWKEVEDNDFGFDEFMTFCRELGTEPLLVVNAGLGSVQSAAEEVEYANGPAESSGGALRSANGHPNPYKVSWWGVGNEMYGPWQLGNVPVGQYVIRHNAMVRGMKAVDPALKIVAVGCPGKWNDEFIPSCALSSDLVSSHYYCERKLKAPFSVEDAQTYELNFTSFSGTIANGIRYHVAEMRKYMQDKRPGVDRLRLALDEWGMVRDWSGTPDGPGIGIFEHYLTMGDTVALGRGFHEVLRGADVTTVATWPETVNVVGAIKTSRNHAVLDPMGHFLALYRGHLTGALLPLKISGKAQIDAVAACDRTRGTVAIGLINYSTNTEISVSVSLGQAAMSPATLWRISGPNLAAINIPGQPESVTTRQLPDPDPACKLLSLPPHSITVFETKLVRP